MEERTSTGDALQTLAVRVTEELWRQWMTRSQAATNVTPDSNGAFREGGLKSRMNVHLDIPEPVESLGQPLGRSG